MQEAFLSALIIFDDEVTKSPHSSPFSTSEFLMRILMVLKNHGVVLDKMESSGFF